jgi:putative ABC transport system permease protein
VKGILKLAYKLLVNDKAKFTALLIGITFAVYLTMFVTSMFIGVLNHASATVINIGASMWVMDPAVQTVSNSGRSCLSVATDICAEMGTST